MQRRNRYGRRQNPSLLGVQHDQGLQIVPSCCAQHPDSVRALVMRGMTLGTTVSLAMDSYGCTAPSKITFHLAFHSLLTASNLILTCPCYLGWLLRSFLATIPAHGRNINSITEPARHSAPPTHARITSKYQGPGAAGRVDKNRAEGRRPLQRRGLQLGLESVGS